MAQDIRYPGVRVGEACGPRTAWQGASAKAQVKSQKINGHKLGTMAQDTRQQCVHDKIIHVFFKWVGGSAPHINMQSGAFRYRKSFEHSPKPSKHPNYTVFNDSNILMSKSVKTKQMSKM